MGLFEWIADLFGFTAPSVIEIIFVCCAVFGSLFFILMMVLMLVGDILGGVIDTAFDTDVSMDSTLAFELFSLQGIAAGIMMFGLTGMFVISATDQEIIAVISGGFAAGGSLYMVRYMMQGISNLQADGTMKHSDAVGSKGHVYWSLMNYNVQVVLRLYLAFFLQNKESYAMLLLAEAVLLARDKTKLIPSGELIKVVDVIGSTLIVEPLSEGDELSSEEE